jgi:hypothetical protein
MRRDTLLCAAALVVLVPCHLRAQLVGTGTTGDNLLPFGGPPSATVYQQLYSASNFPSAGILHSVTFFRGAQSAPLRPGTYDLYVSTTAVGLNALSNVNFDANRGANNLLFGSYALSGTAPIELTFIGAPFFYNPAFGNLLLDFRISGPSVFGGASFRSNADAIGVFSRTFNGPGLGFEGFGLQTRFSISAVPEPSTLALVGIGVIAMWGVGRRRAVDRQGASVTRTSRE